MKKVQSSSGAVASLHSLPIFPVSLIDEYIMPSHMIINRLQQLLGAGNNNSENTEDTEYPTSDSEIDETECIHIGTHEQSGNY